MLDKRKKHDILITGIDIDKEFFLRYSHQRESIYQAVVHSSLHPTANMVYDSLKAGMPQLSLGTVYRNLNQLSDMGRLRKIPLPDGSSRALLVIKKLFPTPEKYPRAGGRIAKKPL